MKFKGTVIAGAMRGKPLIEIYLYRLKSILGFEPYKGTMDIRLEKPINLEAYSTKEISHVLLNGSKKMEAYLAPVTLEIKGEKYECWAIRQEESVYSDTRLEIVAKDNIKEKFSLKDGDAVAVELFSQPRKRTGAIKFIKNLGHEAHLMKS